MKVQQRHESHIHALKSRLVDAESNLRTEKREMKRLQRKYGSKGGSKALRPQYNGAPSFTDGKRGGSGGGGGGGRRGGEGGGGTKNGTSSGPWSQNFGSSGGETGSNGFPETNGLVGGSVVVSGGIGDNGSSSGDPNVDDLVRYQNIARMSFQMNEEARRKEMRPKTTAAGSLRQTSSDQQRLMNRYYLAPDREQTDSALRAALQEDGGTLRLPANFMPSAAPRSASLRSSTASRFAHIEQQRQEHMPRPPSTTNSTKPGGKKKAVVNQINFSNRIYNPL